MNKELILIKEFPRIPRNWNFDESVNKLRNIFYKWKNLTEEMVKELWIAREILSKPGSHESKWNEYCQKIGVDRSTIHRWIDRFFPVANATGRTPLLPERLFKIIYADPPWQFENSGFEQSANSIYPTMSTEEICKLDIGNLAENDAVLFLWATNAMLEDAFDVIRTWGFIYKSNMVWIKNRAPGMGWFTNSKHELLLIGTNGNGLHPKEKVDSWFKSEVTKHSKKPEIVYEIIEKMYSGPYIELFARKTRSGWSSWGNEIENNKS